MTPAKRSLRRLEEDLGELLDRHERTSDLSTFESYADDPVGFIRKVLGEVPWRMQRGIAVAVRDEPLVTVRSCHAAGKDWLAARLALWWCYARRGLVLLTGPTRAQVEEILMRGELREAFTRARDLPGDLHVKALRPTGEGKAGVLAKTASGVSRLTGFHDARVLFVVTEAQDPEISHAWDAAFACATGAEDRILTLGNPVEQSGRFYSAHRPDSGWRAVKIAASDVPNVREGETVVPGLLTREGVDRFAREYGEDSGFYRSRVLAEFPEESEEGVFRREWLEAAASEVRRGELEGRARGVTPVVAVDPSRYGPDASAVARMEGPVVRELVVWRGRADTSSLVGRLRTRLPDWGVKPETKRNDRALDGLGRRRNYHSPPVRETPRGVVVVDEVGLGGGVLDRLREEGFPARGFNGGKAARNSERYFNRRAESYWLLRSAVEAGEVALPDDADLFEELLALRWRPTPQGLVQLETKADLKARIGRSPDRADAVAMAAWEWDRRRRRWERDRPPTHWSTRSYRV